MTESLKVQSHVIRTKETQKVAYTKHTSKNERYYKHIDGMYKYRATLNGYYREQSKSNINNKTNTNEKTI